LSKQLKKKKPTSKKVERSKGKRVYISWEENEVSSTSSSSTNNKETSLCFMMKDEGSISDSVSDFSMESDNYDQLLIAFKETHDEANRLAVICSKLQNVNNILAPKVKSLEEELDKAKIDLVSLELTCLHASIKTCENCKKMEKQVEYLLKLYLISLRGGIILRLFYGHKMLFLTKMELVIILERKTMLNSCPVFFVP